MKKGISVLLCAVLLCSLFAFAATAAPNYCELFQTEIRSLRWSVMSHGGVNVAPGDSFSDNVIMYHMKSKLMQQYYEPESAYIVIPAATFESETAKQFAKVDWNVLRAWKEDNDENTGYNAANKTYSYIAAGGMGDSTTYVVQGYTQSGKQYTVYSYFIDQAGGTIAADAVKGVDYITYNEVDCPVEHRLKTVVETDGTYVKFHSWEKVDSIPAADTLIVPGETVPDPTTTTKKPTTTTTKVTTTTTTAALTGTTAKPLEVVAQIDTAKLETVAEVFPENTVVTVEKIEKAETLQTIETAVKKVATAFVAYEITAKSNNVTVQPNGKVKATFTVPAEYDMSKVVVLYVADDGSTETVPSTVDEASGTVIAELSHFSTYVVAQALPESDDDAQGSNAEKQPDSPLLWIVIAALAVAVLGVALWYFLIFRKK
ncbi:MAG: hypothetical protein IKA63_01025 [Clostridia bacterium]|nr:hypothetical protein [Clostridia bacterium]